MLSFAISFRASGTFGAPVDSSADLLVSTSHFFGGESSAPALGGEGGERVLGIGRAYTCACC